MPFRRNRRLVCTGRYNHGAPMTATPDTVSARPRFADALAVYLKPRVLIVLFLGFSSGLPLALSGSTLLVWMRESGVDLGTIGLFGLVGAPYTLKFLWAPLVDALHVPFFTRAFGRRRGWLVFSQLLLIVAIPPLAPTRPAPPPPASGRARRPRAAAAVRGCACSPGRDLVVAPGLGVGCVSRREPARERAGRRHGIL